MSHGITTMRNTPSNTLPTIEKMPMDWSLNQESRTTSYCWASTLPANTSVLISYASFYRERRTLMNLSAIRSVKNPARSLNYIHRIGFQHAGVGDRRPWSIGFQKWAPQKTAIELVTDATQIAIIHSVQKVGQDAVERLSRPPTVGRIVGLSS